MDSEFEDTDTNTDVSTDESQADAGAPPAPVSAPPTEKTVTLATKKLGELKRLAAERGRRDAMVEMDRKAQELGFADWSAMAAAAAAAKAGGRPATATPSNRVEDSDDESEQARPTATATRTPRPTATDRRAAQRDLALDRANAARAEARREARRARQALEATQAESQMRMAAFRAGVVDVDYGIHLLKQHLAKKPLAELQAFDEAKYFTVDLKKSHPHLYVAAEAPATTAPAAAGASTSPASKTNPSPAAKPVDARTMSPAEFADMLKKRGYSSPSVGMPR